MKIHKEKFLMKISNNWKLILTLTLFIIFFIFSIVCDKIFRYEIYSFFGKIITNSDYGNVLCAVQIGVAAFTITLVSFTSSHNNKTYYNIDTKDILKIKHIFILSIFWLIIAELFLAMLTVLFYYMQSFIVASLLLIYTMALCLIYTMQTIPIITKSDKALIQLLKQNTNKIENFEDDIFNKLLFNYVVENGFEKAYRNLLTMKNKSFLFEQLLKNSLDSINDFKSFEDSSHLKIEIASKITQQLENIKIVLDEQSDIFKDKKNYNQFSIFVARLFYFIQERKNQLDIKTLEKADLTIETLFTYLFANKESNVSRCIFRAFELIFKWTIEYGNIWFLNQLKLAFSKYYYVFTDKYWMKKLFAEISILLFYYTKREKLIDEEFQKKLQYCVANSYKVNAKEYSYTWEDLFKEFINNFNLKISEFIENFDIEEWEFVPYNKSKSCILFQSSVHYWWIQCYLCTTKIFNEFDLGDYNELSDREKANFITAISHLFKKDSDNFILPEDLKEFLEFYGIRDICEKEYFNNKIPFIKNLFEIKNKFEKDKEKQYVRKNSNKYLQELSDYLKKEVLEAFKSSQAYEPELKIGEHEAPIGYYVLEEMFELDNAKQIYKEQIIKSFSNEFKREIEAKFNNMFLSFEGDKIKTTLSQIERIKPTYATQKLMSMLPRFKNFTQEEIQKWQSFDGRILDCNKDLVVPNYVYANKKGIRFNYDLSIFELKQLQEINLQKVLDNYRKDNGTYFYKGVKYEYDELKSLLYEKLFTLKVYISFEAKVDLNNAKLVDVWGIYNRKKERKIKKNED